MVKGYPRGCTHEQCCVNNLFQLIIGSSFINFKVENSFKMKMNSDFGGKKNGNLFGKEKEVS